MQIHHFLVHDKQDETECTGPLSFDGEHDEHACG